MSNGEACPVCGHENGACTGPTPTVQKMIITTTGVRKGPERVPMQKTTGRWGHRASYIGAGTGKIEVYDPEHPLLRIANPLADEDDNSEPDATSDNSGGDGGDGGPEQSEQPADLEDDPASAAAVSDHVEMVPEKPKRTRRPRKKDEDDE